MKYDKIVEKLEQYKHTNIDFFPTYATTQKDLISLIDYYWVSKYRDGAFDNLGFLKPFYNIVVNPSEVAAKMIDIDTKNIKVINEDGASFYPVWFFGRELKFWMKENKFGKLLNEIIYSLPKYGTVVLKKSADEKISIVPLQNLRNNPEVKYLDDDLIIEEHTETLSAFKKHSWDKSKIDEAIGALDKGTKTITWYEAYGEFEKETDNYVIVTEDGVELDSAKLSECPYKEIHWDKIEGRWMGRGTVEKVFEAQIQINKIENYKSSAMHWTSKRIFQTRDDAIEKNLMTDVRNGDIMKVKSEITPIANEERNLSAYMEAENSWKQLIEKLGFSYDIMSGSRPSAGTPLGSMQIQTQMASGFFDLKREDIGLFLKDVIYEWILPTFKKDKRASHVVVKNGFSEEEVGFLNAMLTEGKTNKAVIDYIVKTGNVPSKEEADAIKLIIGEKVKKEKDVEIPESYYTNAKFRIDIDITGESIDLAAKLSSLQVILQLLFSNPAALQDPTIKGYFSQILEAMGINPLELQTPDTTDNQLTAQVAQQGGSIARPQAVTGNMTSMPTKTNV